MALFASGDAGFALFIFALLLWAAIKWVLDHREAISNKVKDHAKQKAGDAIRKWFG